VRIPPAVWQKITYFKNTDPWGLSIRDNVMEECDMVCRADHSMILSMSSHQFRFRKDWYLSALPDFRMTGNLLLCTLECVRILFLQDTASRISGCTITMLKLANGRV
jgi:hypothetical protein